MPPITPAAIAAFRRIEEILDAGQEEDLEEIGGRRGEYLDAQLELHLALHLLPWETLPTDVYEGKRPEWANADWHSADWDKAVALRKALLAAMKP
jgi:hypothetical protein